MNDATTSLDSGSASEEGKYVYCIIKTADERDFGPIGIGDGTNRVYTVRYRDLAAVVSDTPIRIYDPTRENVLAHELVNETVMREFTVIPMSFGTIFRTKQDIVELVLLSGANGEQLAIRERLFDDSSITPAASRRPAWPAAASPIATAPAPSSIRGSATCARRTG